MWLPLLIAALPISLADIRTLTIPKVYLWWISLACVPYLFLNGFGPLTNLFVVMLALASLSLLGLGMGDVKLLSIISLVFNSYGASNFSYLALLMLLSASCYVIVKTLRDCRLPGSIPLAPSIFMGLALYLASS
jgi:Flp pilus assembly protein protease CpaA